MTFLYPRTSQSLLLVLISLFHMCFSLLLLLYLIPAFLIPMGVDKDLGPVDPNFSLLQYNEKYLFQSLKLGSFENQRGSLQTKVPE